ncbi:lysozyme [Phenylobacterium sp.]|uniref:lysozyme n=1 Tax=Phenylobacterium sp. TaxID=1871053 RepID=UPI00301D1037
MLSRHRVSRAAIELIKRFEGYRRHAAQLPDGRWTIGYGHTLTARAGAEVSEPDAEALLVYDLIAVQHAVNESLYAPIGQNQFDALCSFAFNIGLDNFRRSQVLKRLNAGAMVQAGCAMELWRKTDFEGERIVLDALVRRRAQEKALFLTPDDGAWAAAPSSVLRPAIDLDALDLVPVRRPVTVEASFQGDTVSLRREGAVTDEPGIPAEPPPDLVSEPVAAVTAAAEAVTSRLESIFADPGREPEAVAGAVASDSASDPAPAEPPEPGPRPQADFAPPFITLPDRGPDPGPEPRPDLELDRGPPRFETAADAELDIPRAPQGSAFPDVLDAPLVNLEVGPSEFIPARTRPAARPKEPSLVPDLLLALLGLAFFGFGLFWGLNWRGDVGGIVTPRMVAWSAGLAGVGFVAVAVFRLLQRLGREAERD